MPLIVLIADNFQWNQNPIITKQ